MAALSRQARRDSRLPIRSRDDYSAPIGRGATKRGPTLAAPDRVEPLADPTRRYSLREGIVKRLSVLLAFLLLLVWALPVTAAGKPERSPFQLPAEGITLPEGTVCDFEVLLTPLVNKEYQKVFPPDASGRVRTLINGRLVTRVTNVETGESLVTNASGPGTLWTSPDGSIDFVTRGRAVTWFFAGEPFGPGLYLTRGRLAMHFTPEGSIASAVASGPMTNLCVRLS